MHSKHTLSPNTPSNNHHYYSWVVAVHTPAVVADSILLVVGRLAVGNMRLDRTLVDDDIQIPCPEYQRYIVAVIVGHSLLHFG